MFNNPFEGIPIGLQPSTSDAASTTTLATTTASSPAEDDNVSSLRTTPEVVKGTTLKKLRNVLGSHASKKIDVGAAEIDEQTTGTVVATNDQQAISTTRRRSQRIKSNILTTTTTTSIRTAATITAVAIPKKKSPRALSTTPAQSLPFPDPETPAENDGPPSKTRALRSTVKNPATQKPEAIIEPPRRASTRVSALNATAAITTIVAPKTRPAKRVRESETADAETADAEKEGASKKAKSEVEEAEGPSAKLAEKKPSQQASAPAGAAPAPPSKRKKVWISQGLYVGQENDGASLNLRPSSKKGRAKKEHRPNALPLPMFRGKDIMDTSRDFKLPFSVFAPSAVKCPAPPVWRKLSHSKFPFLCPSPQWFAIETDAFVDQLIGDAKYIWKKEGSSNVKCVCTEDCSESCLNRCTWVECTDSNCDLGRNCSNRPFADLMDRVKSGKEFGVGVEVAQTTSCGYGLRALRSFEPNQIIVEYSGEIITQEESERRLEEVYNNDTVNPPCRCFFRSLD